ncbi:MAG: hypothetical protein WBD40_22925, partial [Tepidisphaeraceae bacterium]
TMQRHRVTYFVVVIAVLVGSSLAAGPFAPPETDPDSPRKSKLTSDKPDGQILRVDLDADGDPDVLELWWNGKRARWIDENDDMRPADVRGDLASDVVQIDRDGDGFYDGEGDLSIKWADDDGDGRADVQLFGLVMPAGTWLMAFIDVDHDGVNGYIDWTTFEFNAANWRVKPTASPTHTIPPPNFSPDYMGNSIFLKQHRAGVITNPQRNWENPFCFYDFDGDGLTEMAIRLIDTAQRTGGTDSAPQLTYTGYAHHSYVAFDLDNDSSKGNEVDFDLSYRFFSEGDGSKGQRIDYRQHQHKHPAMKAPQWVLDAKLFRFDDWRRLDHFEYVPHDRCFEETFRTDWASTWIVFDEDDDDHRWERVELCYPTRNLYSTARWKGGDQTSGGLPGNVQSDTLGDRGEWDADNSGKGKLYVGRWDGKLHLYGAESGAWIVDDGARYWGSSPVLGNSSPQRATKVGEVVQYHDTDGNGFFDRITYDYDGDQTIDLTINLADTGKPDEHDLIDPGTLGWQGLHELHKKHAAESFQDALRLYRALWKKGLTTPQLDDLAIASSIGEQYENGYWLKERIFRLLDGQVTGAAQDALRRAHFAGDVAATVKLIEGL